MKDIKDYLHLYKGVCVEVHGKSCELSEVHKDSYTYLGENGWTISDFRDTIPKPILRPLSDMTEEELCEMFNEKFSPEFARAILKDISKSLYELYKFIGEYGEFDTLPKLLKAGFDLFGLIESGLAIQKP